MSSVYFALSNDFGSFPVGKMESEFMKYAGAQSPPAQSPPAQFLPAQFLPAQFPSDAIPDVDHELLAPDLGIKNKQFTTNVGGGIGVYFVLTPAKGQPGSAMDGISEVEMSEWLTARSRAQARAEARSEQGDHRQKVTAQKTLARVV